MTGLVQISKGAIAPENLFSKETRLFFEIRPPQRRFKWAKQQIDDLWRDIRRAYRKNPDPKNPDSYFLGTLLLVPLTDGHVSVIDGQQRIATISILLAVLRDCCKEYPDLRMRADGIQQLISRVDNDGNRVGPLVVTLQDPDNEVYIDIVKEFGSTVSASSQSGLLGAAAKKLSDHVKDHLEELDASDRQQELRQLCEYIQTKIKFLPLEVGSEGEGYLVFDTTNTRGMRLSPSEALKGRLATIAREDGDLSTELIERWNAAAMKLEAAELRIDAMDDYLHAIWCSREGYTTKRTLDRISDKLTKIDKLREFVRDVESYCPSYLAVVAPRGKSLLSENLYDLKRLNVQSNSFLTMVHKHSRNRFEDAVDLVLSLQIRNVTMGSHQPNEYEKDWPNWAIDVRNGNTEKAFAEIRNRMVADEEFQEQFESEPVVSPATAHHLLRRLDPINRPGSGVQPIEVHVEHILPKSVVAKLVGGKNLTPNVKHWIVDLVHDIPDTADEKYVLGKGLERLLYMLGNQALLDGKANSGARDLPFGGKRDFYREQALKLTRALAGNEKWGESEILARQREMAKRAPLIWPK